MVSGGNVAGCGELSGKCGNRGHWVAVGEEEEDEDEDEEEEEVG
jgi:hypothetical protein